MTLERKISENNSQLQQVRDEVKESKQFVEIYDDMNDLRKFHQNRIIFWYKLIGHERTIFPYATHTQGNRLLTGEGRS